MRESLHQRRTSRGTAGGERGFTLLEVLIALVVLSIGMLGIAALQGVGLRSSHGAQLASQAGLLAYDMADRIRANPDEFLAYSNFDSNCIDPIPVTPLVDADLAEWSCSIEALLPAGAGRIRGVQADGVSTYTITIEWQDRLIQDDEDIWDFTLVIDI